MKFQFIKLSANTATENLRKNQSAICNKFHILNYTFLHPCRITAAHTE